MRRGVFCFVAVAAMVVLTFTACNKSALGSGQAGLVGRTPSKEDFLKHLMNGEKLHLFFSDNWTFVYHSDGRCAGSTDGEKSKLSKFEIDKVIKIKVVNDGDGWYSDDLRICDGKKVPTVFYLDFRLKESVKNWDRFEITDDYAGMEKNVVYIKGAGMSEYLKLYYDGNKLIIKMEYRNEDPG